MAEEMPEELARELLLFLTETGASGASHEDQQ